MCLRGNYVGLYSITPVITAAFFQMQVKPLHCRAFHHQRVLTAEFSHNGYLLYSLSVSVKVTPADSKRQPAVLWWPHPMQPLLTLLPALCKDIQVNQVQNQPFKKPFVPDGSKKQYPSSPPQDCGYNIFCFVFKHLALISRATLDMASLLIPLVFLISMWILVTQLLHIFASFTSPFLCTNFYTFW